MRTYSYQTTGVTTADQLAYRNNMIEKQNNLAKGLSGGTPLPQFSATGLPVGIDPNQTIQKMAALQSKMDASNVYSQCSGKAAGTCGGRPRRSRRSRRSRQKKVKSKKKYHKI
jgi:hypothetical protein